MRLIDADLMAIEESEAYMSAQTKVAGTATKLVNEVVHKKIQMLLADAPTVDAVEVVRCRECIHFGLYVCPMCYIEKQELIFINHDPDFYCGHGERKENG